VRHVSRRLSRVFSRSVVRGSSFPESSVGLRPHSVALLEFVPKLVLKGAHSRSRCAQGQAGSIEVESLDHQGEVAGGILSDRNRRWPMRMAAGVARFVLPVGCCLQQPRRRAIDDRGIERNTSIRFKARARSTSPVREFPALRGPGA